jgi:diguanylate cyclase (GGDEF)-like protein
LAHTGARILGIEEVSLVGEGNPGAGKFVVYADFNCPFSHSLNERLHALNLEGRIDFRCVQHAPSASSQDSDLNVLAELTREVADIRRRAPSVPIMVPLFRPDSRPASQLLVAVAARSPAEAVQLRGSIFRALWVDGLDISSPQVLETLLADIGIERPVIDAAADETLSCWQAEWRNNNELEGVIPVVISGQGEKVIGFPLEPELNAFLQTGSLVSDEVLHDLSERKPLQRILVLDNDATSLRMIIEQMSATQIEIVEDFESLVAAALEQGMPDLVVIDTAMIHDTETTDSWRNSSAADLDGQLPFIFVSDDNSTAAEVAAFEAGAADFIAKPFHPRVLQARLKMHLHARESQRQLNNIARVDGLTSICNRREFDLRLMSEWSRGARNGNPLSLLMIDVDKFKEYNDHYGHLRGDECLIAVAQILNGCIQRTSDLIARYGGEEFVALLPDSDLEGALTVAEDCLEALAEAGIPHAKSDVASCVTVSIGVASMLPLHEKSSTILIEQADIALYQAKQNGRNRICSFNEWS